MDNPGTSTISLRTRYRGALLGLACGDALGTTLEFTGPSPPPLTDLVGGGPFGLAPGQWTDDTSMALCLAESLVECGGFQATDQMTRYRRWQREGYLSSTGTCFDIGTTIAAALRRFANTGDPMAGDPDPSYGGNGSLMRLAPIPLAFAGQPDRALHFAGEMSRTTHAAPEPVDTCRYYAGLIVGALQGRSKDELLAPQFTPVDGVWEQAPLAPAIATIAGGSFKTRQPPAIRGSGFVVHALEAALWAFFHSDDFREGALLAVNLGEDADTTGAIYGQLAGAYYGASAIPPTWSGQLAMGERIADLADALLELAGNQGEDVIP
jgi:ADP-ribosylglycohydrolase